MRLQALARVFDTITPLSYSFVSEMLCRLRFLDAL